MVVNFLNVQVIAICEEIQEDVVTTKKKFVVSAFLIKNNIYYLCIFMTLNRVSYYVKIIYQTYLTKVYSKK